MTDDDRKNRLSFAIFWAMWQRRVSPPALAKAIGKSPDTIRRWRDGETAPSVLDVEGLAAALGVRVDYFTAPPVVPPYPFDDYLVEPAEPALLTHYREQTGSRSGDAARDATRLAREDSQAEGADPAPSPDATGDGRRRTPKA